MPHLYPDPIDVVDQKRAVAFQDALRETLRSPAGRHAWWQLLAHTGVFRSIWEASARIHYNAGRQDVGHEVLAAILEVDEDAYQQMQREARARTLQAGRDRIAATESRKRR